MSSWQPNLQRGQSQPCRQANELDVLLSEKKESFDTMRLNTVEDLRSSSEDSDEDFRP